MTDAVYKEDANKILNLFREQEIFESQKLNLKIYQHFPKCNEENPTTYLQNVVTAYSKIESETNLHFNSYQYSCASDDYGDIGYVNFWWTRK